MHSYEALVRCASDACLTPMATLAIVEHGRARFKASVGADCADELPLSFSLLRETLASDDVFIVEDTRSDQRFAGSELVTSGPRVGAFAGVALHSPAGKVVGVLAVADHQARDFSPEQLASLRDFGRIASSLVFSRRELALHRLMSRAIEEALDFVLLTDGSPPSQGGPYIEYANASLLHALGFSSDELVGRPYAMLFARDNDGATLDSILQNLEAAKDNEKEVRLCRKNGTTFWAEFAAHPLMDGGENPSHWVTVGRDITSNREALTQTAALLHALDSVNDHVEIYSRENTDYVLTFQNAAIDAATSEVFERLLSDSSVRERVEHGEAVLFEEDGIQLRPLGPHTVICVKRDLLRVRA
jgi:PAS domain S-box-containing protein